MCWKDDMMEEVMFPKKKEIQIVIQTGLLWIQSNLRRIKSHVRNFDPSSPSCEIDILYVIISTW